MNLEATTNINVPFHVFKTVKTVEKLYMYSRPGMSIPTM